MASVKERKALINVSSPKKSTGSASNRSIGTLQRPKVSKLAEQVSLTHVNTIPTTKKITIIKEGISKNQLEQIKEEAALDYDTLSAILSVSRATLIKKKGSEKFDQPTSERIMLLADIISYGGEVFEDKTRFNAWLRKENKALGGKTPLELMDTVYGIEEIKKELTRIEYGVF